MRCEKQSHLPIGTPVYKGLAALDQRRDLFGVGWMLGCLGRHEQIERRPAFRLRARRGSSWRFSLPRKATCCSEQRLRADCLVLDIRLDGMSGLELEEVLAAAGSTVPVVVMTAHDDPSTRERARRAGAVDYLRKPFDDELLIGAINRAIGRA
jgi:CheY-like chemotaxis protein